MVLLSYGLLIGRSLRPRRGIIPAKNYISPEANAGIWAGAGVKTGHVVTFSGKKTKRTWKPNVREREYYSEVLDETLKYTFTNKAVRAIDRAGGFDNYILRTSDKRLVSRAAVALKTFMNRVLAMKAKGDKSLEEIKKELRPSPNTGVWEPRVYTNRFYFDWRGPRRHMVFC